MNKKIKKTLKVTGGIIIGVAGVIGVYSLVKHPEVRGEIVGSLKKVGEMVTGSSDKEGVPQETPKREGRNKDGYFKPRYNNKKFNN